MSEIDDIFASKGKAKAPDAVPAKESADKKKKKKKKSSKTPVEESKPESSSSKKRPAPETVVDPSVQIPQKRQKVRAPTENAAKSKKDKEDEEDFKDSRGTGPRMCSLLPSLPRLTPQPGRKTEEGWSIFKEAELGIDPTAGGKQVHRHPYLLFTSVRQTRPCVHSIAIVVSVRSLSHSTPETNTTQVSSCMQYTGLHLECASLASILSRLFRSLPNRPRTMGRGGQKIANSNLLLLRQDARRRLSVRKHPKRSSGYIPSHVPVNCSQCT